MFLTRGKRTPTTDQQSHGQWQHLTWRQIAAMAQAATGPVPDAAPGVDDYISTLEAYHRV